MKRCFTVGKMVNRFQEYENRESERKKKCSRITTTTAAAAMIKYKKKAQNKRKLTMEQPWFQTNRRNEEKKCTKQRVLHGKTNMRQNDSVRKGKRMEK